MSTKPKVHELDAPEATAPEAVSPGLVPVEGIGDVKPEVAEALRVLRENGMGVVNLGEKGKPVPGDQTRMMALLNQTGDPAMLLMETLGIERDPEYYYAMMRDDSRGFSSMLGDLKLKGWETVHVVQEGANYLMKRRIEAYKKDKAEEKALRDAQRGAVDREGTYKNERRAMSHHDLEMEAEAEAGLR